MLTSKKRRQLEQRVAFRRAQKQAIQRAMRAGAKGNVKPLSGRLNGADIARAEGYLKELPTSHTSCRHRLRLGRSIDTTYGKLGVKV